MNATLLMALQLLQVIPDLVAAGVEVKGLVDEYSTKLNAMAAEKRDPTAEEWAELNATIQRLRSQLHS